MIVTRQWLQEYIDISKISTQSLCKALNSIGLEVDSTQRTLIPNNVVVGYIEACEKHPDADKLNICQVNIGNKTEQIVCGAKNVQKGQYVAVATVGAILGEDFKIKKAKLRGVESNGMICSSTEIGLPKLFDGIMELDNSIGELIIGKELNEYSLINDEIIEIELTANRGDCLSINGVARELSTYFNIALNNIEVIVNTNNKGIGQFFEINYEMNCESNLIYKAASIKNFKLDLLHNLRASTIEQLKSTDIQTASAYATHSSGVLINVYSKAIATEQKENLFTLSIAKDEDGFDTVSGKMLLSTVGIDAGNINNNCDEIIIEASYTNPEKLAQRVFDKKKKTGDIYYKASRGSEPNLESGIDAIITLLSQNGASIYNGSKNFINEIAPETININNKQLNAIIGQNIAPSKVSQILTSLGFFVKQDGQNTINVTIPTFRHDIKNIADVTEEIVRMIGIDKIKSKPLELKEFNNNNETSRKINLKNNLRFKAITNGFFETLTYVFTNKELLTKYKFPTVIKKKDILNPIVNELNTFRTTMALNFANAVSHNVKQGYKSIGLFEIGTIFDKNRNETKTLGFVFSGELESESIANKAKPISIDFFGFCQKISSVIGEFELEMIKEVKNTFIHPYQSATIIQNGKEIGTIYKIHPNTASDFDISNDTYMAEIDIDLLNDDIIIATNISKFQSSKRDLSIIAPKDLEYKKIKKAINSLKIDEIKQFNLVDIYNDEKLGENESLTIKFILQSETKTFEESDINEIMDKVLNKLEKDLQIGLR
ncbi:phenylalanine--tRNA ligase subunit beta [Arcobacter sp. 15-2]|uniref:phenylalanine--tRNA ligase subunit beta n=1 Tax=Arcobacter sp. 15-2 TaxID=3374109 RepID=UPI00399CEBE0